LLDVFRDRIKLVPNGTLDMKKWGERAVYVQLETLLRSKTDVKIPDSTPHSPPRVEESGEADSIPRQKARAMAIYLSNKIQEWEHQALINCSSVLIDDSENS
jgi:hypothetical protein